MMIIMILLLMIMTKNMIMTINYKKNIYIFFLLIIFTPLEICLNIIIILFTWYKIYVIFIIKNINNIIIISHKFVKDLYSKNLIPNKIDFFILFILSILPLQIFPQFTLLKI